MNVNRVLAWSAILALPIALVLVRSREKKRLIPQPRGMVLGLYAGVPDYDYREELDRIAATGATAVSLQAIYRMERHDSSEVVRHPTSSPTDAALLRTFRQAKTRGLRVMFFPTINLRAEADIEKWWRGNIRPNDWDTWWKNYTVFNVHLAELASEGDVEWYSVGTEMASTQAFPERWCALVAAVRTVFPGKIVYSVNFDSHDSFTFGSCLDVIGINTYDPIAKFDEYPSAVQIRDEWWWIVNKARTLQARFHRPVMITEVGYPSVAHAHVGPWDFRTDKPLDLALQNELVKGAFGVLRNWSDGEAVFYYLYGEHLKQKPVGGPNDRTYAIWGKPVEKTVTDYFALPIFEGHIPPRQGDIDEAVVQSLAAQLRKERDYEDGKRAPWAVQWMKDHPEDEILAWGILDQKPRTGKKIPKGHEKG